MYIALTMRKLLEEKGEFKKLAGIPLCIIYNQDDTMSVQDHILLNETKLKEEYMKAMTIGEPSLDIGMMIGDLSWTKADGILILNEEEAKLLQKTEIQRDRYTLYVVTSLKEALEIYKKNSKKSTGKRTTRKTEKSQEESVVLNQNTKQDTPDTNDEESINLMAGMNPPEANTMTPEEDNFEALEDASAEIPEYESTEEPNESGFVNNIQESFMDAQENGMEYAQENQENGTLFQTDFNSSQYAEFENELQNIGVNIEKASFILKALQLSTNVSDFYEYLEKTIEDIDDVLILYDQIQEYYDHFKDLADQIGIHNAYASAPQA